MDPFSISPATITDLHQLVQLVNRAYRGEAARKGWTHEADLIGGTVRTDASSIEETLKNPDAIILKYAEGKKNSRVCLFGKTKRHALSRHAVC